MFHRGVNDPCDKKAKLDSQQFFSSATVSDTVQCASAWILIVWFVITLLHWFYLGNDKLMLMFPSKATAPVRKKPVTRDRVGIMLDFWNLLSQILCYCPFKETFGRQCESKPAESCITVGLDVLISCTVCIIWVYNYIISFHMFICSYVFHLCIALRTISWIFLTGKLSKNECR
jgi:hypothetical protein